ncbi:S8 family serine peptidase [Nocardia sp. NPDC059246]|uniref:S8 family serine peptidase n=1 Tax=unclassified Nocardia TaxID=2637762 RepID=UPI0036B06643
MRQLDLNQVPPEVWPDGTESVPSPYSSGQSRVLLPFVVELHDVPIGTELLYADELRQTFYDLILDQPGRRLTEIATSPFRLAASPNWRYDATGVPEKVPNPFTISSNNAAYLVHLGLVNQKPNDGAGINIAVLDNGFDATFWQGAPTPVPVGKGLDLIPGDASTQGHGTLVTALIASAVPAANIQPIRMAGDDSTEWDILHALTRAVLSGANVITLAYRQSLGTNTACVTCGMTRAAARSEVFAALLKWAAEGRRAILVAAGNGGKPSIAPPARYSGAVPVTALDVRCKTLANLSNWDATGSLDVIAAPGEDVAASKSGGSYCGTSFATAYAAALYATAMTRFSTVDAHRVSSALATHGTISRANVVKLP